MVRRGRPGTRCQNTDRLEVFAQHLPEELDMVQQRFGIVRPLRVKPFVALEGEGAAFPDQALEFFADSLQFAG